MNTGKAGLTSESQRILLHSISI